MFILLLELFSVICLAGPHLSLEQIKSLKSKGLYLPEGHMITVQLIDKETRILKIDDVDEPGAGPDFADLEELAKSVGWNRENIYLKYPERAIGIVIELKQPLVLMSRLEIEQRMRELGLAH